MAEADSTDVPRTTWALLLAGVLAWALMVAVAITALGVLPGVVIAVWGVSVPGIVVMVVSETRPARPTEAAGRVATVPAASAA